MFKSPFDLRVAMMGQSSKSASGKVSKRRRNEEEEEEEEGWDRLPQEVIERILSSLPAASVCQSRLVCKKWHSILSSDSFLELWKRSSPEASWFLVYHNSQGFAAFNPASNKWNNIPIFKLCSLDSRQALLMASSGGLLCFRSRNMEFPSLTVCNPVTGTYRVLPDMLRIRYIDIIGMAVDKSANRYKILVTGTTESSVSNSITEVYDSAVGKWDYQCNCEHDYLQFWYGVHAVWCEGVFYCLTMPIVSTRGHRLLAYDMRRKDWRDLCVRMPSSDLRCPSLLACRGRLLLAGKIVVENTIKSVRVWELNKTTMTWVPIGSMPDPILSRIHVPYFLVIQCFGDSDLICFSRYRGWQSVIYDLSKKTWHWIPENKEVCNELKAQDTTLDRNNLVGMSYEPSISAKV